MNYRLTLITAVLIVCALCSTHSFAEEVVEKGYHYEINQQDHVATLVRYDGSSSNVTVPNTIKYNGVEYHVTAIHGHAFSERQIKKKIKKVRIGYFVKSIGDNTFEGCAALVSVDFGNSLSVIGYSAFYGCTSLESITIPSSVTSIGNYAFADCTSLNSIEIGANVTTIGSKAFKNCFSITTLVLPRSLTTIGDEAFAGCEKLKTVTCHADKVPMTDISAFNYVSLKNVVLKVPELSIGEYKKQTPWKDFGTITQTTSTANIDHKRMTEYRQFSMLPCYYKAPKYRSRNVHNA